MKTADRYETPDHHRSLKGQKHPSHASSHGLHHTVMGLIIFEAQTFGYFSNFTELFLTLIASKC